MVPRWLPGSEKEPFGVTLACLFEVFSGVFCVIVYATCNVFVQACGDLRSYFFDQGLSV